MRILAGILVGMGISIWALVEMLWKIFLGLATAQGMPIMVVFIAGMFVIAGGAFGAWIASEMG